MQQNQQLCFEKDILGRVRGMNIGYEQKIKDSPPKVLHALLECVRADPKRREKLLNTQPVVEDTFCLGGNYGHGEDTVPLIPCMISEEDQEQILRNSQLNDAITNWDDTYEETVISSGQVCDPQSFGNSSHSFSEWNSTIPTLGEECPTGSETYREPEQSIQTAENPPVNSECATTGTHEVPFLPHENKIIGAEHSDTFKANPLQPSDGGGESGSAGTRPQQKIQTLLAFNESMDGTQLKLGYPSVEEEAAIAKSLEKKNSAFPTPKPVQHTPAHSSSRSSNSKRATRKAPKFTIETLPFKSIINEFSSLLKHCIRTKSNMLWVSFTVASRTVKKKSSSSTSQKPSSHIHKKPAPIPQKLHPHPDVAANAMRGKPLHKKEVEVLNRANMIKKMALKGPGRGTKRGLTDMLPTGTNMAYPFLKNKRIAISGSIESKTVGGKSSASCDTTGKRKGLETKKETKKVMLVIYTLFETYSCEYFLQKLKGLYAFSEAMGYEFVCVSAFEGISDVYNLERPGVSNYEQGDLFDNAEHADNGGEAALNQNSALINAGPRDPIDTFVSKRTVLDSDITCSILESKKLRWSTILEPHIQAALGRPAVVEVINIKEPPVISNKDNVYALQHCVRQVVRKTSDMNESWPYVFFTAYKGSNEIDFLFIARKDNRTNPQKPNKKSVQKSEKVNNRKQFARTFIPNSTTLKYFLWYLKMFDKMQGLPVNVFSLDPEALARISIRSGRPKKTLNFRKEIKKHKEPVLDYTDNPFIPHVCMVEKELIQRLTENIRSFRVNNYNEYSKRERNGFKRVELDYYSVNIKETYFPGFGESDEKVTIVDRSTPVSLLPLVCAIVDSEQTYDNFMFGKQLVIFRNLMIAVDSNSIALRALRLKLREGESFLLTSEIYDEAGDPLTYFGLENNMKSLCYSERSNRIFQNDSYDTEVLSRFHFLTGYGYGHCAFDTKDVDIAKARVKRIMYDHAREME